MTLDDDVPLHELPAPEGWYRYCYRFSSWKFAIGWPDGFARSHWMSDKAGCEESVRIVQERGGEAFMETQRRLP